MKILRTASLGSNFTGAYKKTMYGEKKSLDENQRFDWIKTIH